MINKPLLNIANELYKRHSLMVDNIKKQSSVSKTNDNIVNSSNNNTPSFKELVRDNLKNDVISIKNNLAITDKFIKGKASLVEVKQSVKELEHTVQKVTTILNKVVESWKKIMDMGL